MVVAGKREQRPISGEELLRLGDIGRCELVEGKIVSMSPTGYRHGLAEALIARALSAYADTGAHGSVMTGEVGIWIRRDPDTVRAADVVFISRQKLALQKSTAYLDVAPELVVEILSPDDRWSDVIAKLGDYFSAGVTLAWVVDLKLGTVFAYRSLTSVEKFTSEAVLTAADVLPGFFFPLANLFHE